MTGANRKSVAKRVGNGALNKKFSLSYPPQGGFLMLKEVKYKVVPPKWPLLDHQIIWWFNKGFFMFKKPERIYGKRKI